MNPKTFIKLPVCDYCTVVNNYAPRARGSEKLIMCSETPGAMRLRKHRSWRKAVAQINAQQPPRRTWRPSAPSGKEVTFDPGGENGYHVHSVYDTQIATLAECDVDGKRTSGTLEWLLQKAARTGSTISAEDGLAKSIALYAMEKGYEVRYTKH